jgi:protocatechuate 3,4-dioxygenase beta subunit
MSDREDRYDRAALAAHPPLAWPGYRSTLRRAPAQAPIDIAQTRSELDGPWLAPDEVAADEADLTRGHAGAPLGERIVVTGHLLDEADRPLAGRVIEIWQANAAGRYAHDQDQHAAPLDPSFTGVGRAVTDATGCYRFVTIKPGAYPWRNHPNAWRPAHIHVSVLGPSFLSRLVTQMYFPGDPLLELDPIFNAVPAPCRDRLVARFDLAVTEPEWALGYRFDLVVRGPRATPEQT